MFDSVGFGKKVPEVQSHGEITAGNFPGKHSHLEFSNIVEDQSSAFYPKVTGWVLSNSTDFSQVAATWEGGLQIPKLVVITDHQPVNFAQIHF